MRRRGDRGEAFTKICTIWRLADPALRQRGCTVCASAQFVIAAAPLPATAERLVDRDVACRPGAVALHELIAQAIERALRVEHLQIARESLLIERYRIVPGLRGRGGYCSDAADERLAGGR